MSPEAESVLAEHNQEAVDSLVAYISHYVSAHLESLPPASVLPLSGFAYPLTTTAASKSASHLRQQPLAACGILVEAIGHPSGISECGGALHIFCKECHISSPFAAVSGRHVKLQLLSSLLWYFRCRLAVALHFVHRNVLHRSVLPHMADILQVSAVDQPGRTRLPPAAQLKCLASHHKGHCTHCHYS